MNHPTPQGLQPLPAAFGYLCDWGNDSLGLTRQTVYYGEPGSATENDWNEFPKVHKNEPIFTAGQMQAYAREALAAQAATLESIHKIIECAGPDAADEIADLLGYPSVEWPSDQALTAPNLACKSAQARLATQWGYVRAASVEPVGRVARVEWCAHEQKWRHVIWADKKVPFGTPVFASAPPSPANVPGAVEPLTKDDIDKLAEVLEVTSLDEVEPETVYAFTRAIEARFAPQPQAVAASSPATAVDADRVLNLADRYRCAQAGRDAQQARTLLEAALQASRQPQAQQAVAEGAGDGLRQTLIDVGRVIAWQCFGDCRAYDEFGPGSLRGLHEMDAEIRAALATPQPEPEWSPAYTRGPARQSAPVTAVPALVPLSVLQYNQIPELCQIRPSLYESVVRAIEAAIAKINGLTVGDGGQG